ncbi:MAG: RtcB family protein [Polyangiaceae bacterium]|nr:RtcB family protein [Polyangiaceae bacterium]
MASRHPSFSTSETPPRLRRVGNELYEVSRTYRRDMRASARVFADAEQAASLGTHDRSLAQLINVTTLPGIAAPALGMPDMHEGYGFPVGGVAATLLPDGVISPGGIGFDINCGVRLLTAPVDVAAVRPVLESLIHEISRGVPTGAGRGGRLSVAGAEMDRVLAEGVPYLVRELGQGRREDLTYIEGGGCLDRADPHQVSDRAKLRGRDQLGTLGSGNHFVEVGVVDNIFDDVAAAQLGLAMGGVTVLIHTGSRGLGHQVCTDYVRRMDDVARRYGIVLPDRQLACAPLSSPEGTAYFAAMCAAANFAFCNRQVITERARDAFRRFIDCELSLVYDVAHNTAKIERAGDHLLCVHRKGATRAFGPSSSEIPEHYRGVGQPVFIPGTMGTASYVLVGTDASAQLSLSSTCHGAGRTLSRGAAKRAVRGHELRRQLEGRGIVIRCPSNAELAEEAPLAYKDVERVVDVTERAGIAKKVARLRPLGVIKG